VSVSGAGGNATILIGSEAPLGDRVYVRLTKSESVVSTDGAIYRILPEKATEWREKQVFAGSPGKTVRMELWNEERSFVQLLRKDSSWKMMQPIVCNADDGFVNELLGKLYSLKVAEFIWDASSGAAPGTDAGLPVNKDRFVPYGLASDQARVKVSLWLEGAETAQHLLLGKTAGDGGETVYARLAGNNSVYSLPAKVNSYLDVGVGKLRSRKLYHMKKEQVGFIDIESGEKRLTLARNTNGIWEIRQPLRWRADRKKINAFLEGLMGLKAEGFFSSAATNLNAIGFDPPAWSVQVLRTEPAGISGDEPGGEGAGNGSAPDPAETRKRERLLISRPTGAEEKVLARFSDKPLKFGNEGFVYTLDKEAFAFAGRKPADPLEFFNRTMMALEPRNVMRIEISRDGRTQAVMRDKDGIWTAAEDEKGKADQSRIRDILFAVSNLRANSVKEHAVEEPEAYGLKSPGFMLSFGLKGKDGIQKTLKLGYRAKTDGIYAMVQGRDVVFVLPAGLVQKLARPIVVPATDTEAD
jgi:hypothetical protein